MAINKTSLTQTERNRFVSMSQRTFIIFFEHNLVQKKNYNITMYCTYVTRAGTCDYLIIIIF
jgi:hypothetical protein